MNITYQHVNPDAGNESYLIRVYEEQKQRTTCILVDAGDGVDIDVLLDDDEYLDAVLLTHAHVDHYQSLGTAHRDRAKIFTSPDTASILRDVFTEGRRHYGLDKVESLLEHVRPLDNWHELVTDTIRVRPVPAGHAPGACGFILQIQDDSHTFHALATGDFTLRDAAGYPGFDPETYPDIDALFLTAVTSNDAEATLTDIVATLTERANAGATTLCTASGLTGVHLATLLAAIGDRFARSVPVVLAGQVAKLYDDLDYAHANVETVPEFSDPERCLAPGTVTIAGPEVPAEGSSQRLFDVIRSDSNAVLVQVQSGTATSKDASDARATVTSFYLSNHPTEAVLDDLVEELRPTHVVIEHQRERMAEKYKDKWDAYTWATGTDREETLYAEGTLTSPRWVTEATHRRVRNATQPNQFAESTELLAKLSPPQVGRRDEIRLEAEGVDVSELKKRLHIESSASNAEPAQPTRATTDGGGERATASAEPSTDTPNRLYRTTGPDTGSVESVPLSTEDDEPYTGDGLVDTISPSVPPTQKDRPIVEGTTDGASDLTSENETATRETQADEKGEEGDGSDGTDVTADTTEQTDSCRPESDAHQTASETTRPDTSFVAQIDPAVRALAEQRATATDCSLGAYTATVCEEFLGAVLRGEEPLANAGSVVDERSVSVDADPAFEQLLETVADDEGYANTSSFVAQMLCDAVGLETDTTTLPVRGPGVLSSLLEAVVENESCPFNCRDAIVQVALERRLLD